MLNLKRIILPAVMLAGAAGCIYGVHSGSSNIFLLSLFGTLFVCLLCACVLFMRSAWKRGLFEKGDRFLYVSMTGKQKLMLCAVVALLILVCTLPMGLSPHFNGTIPQHRNQYELMTEALLKSRLHLNLYVDPPLLALENPYDPQARKEAGAFYMWDHAFYDGQYFMYFGIVPVFLAFLPYRLITGTPLITYHATQLFTAFIIIGIFMLFGLLVRLFFRHLSLGRYIALSASVSALSVWYGVAAPAMYCTAVTSAICLVIWSLYFFIRAVFAEPTQNRQIFCAFIASGLGALAFGCRPPIALANVLVLPLLAVYLKRSKLTLRLFFKLVLAASPYVVVAALLMTYNYLRFDNPFEFGQSYQLTIADQSQYMNSLASLDIGQALRAIWDFFFAPFALDVPEFGGVFMNFPVLLLVFGLFYPPVRRALKARGLLGFAFTLLLTPLIITVMDVLWSPVLLERYRMDIYFIMGILCFLVICCCGEQEAKRPKRFDCLTYGFSFVTFFTSVLLFLIPYDWNWTYHIMKGLFPLF